MSGINKSFQKNMLFSVILVLMLILMLSCGKDKTTDIEETCGWNFDDTVYGFFTGNVLYSIAVEDFDSDGYLDFAIPNFTSETVSIVFFDTSLYAVTDTNIVNDSTIIDTLSWDTVRYPDITSTDYDVGEGPWGICAGDFDNDLDIDLAVTNEKSGSLSILLNQGDGTFDVAVNYSAGERIRSIQSGDIDNDNDIDLVVGCNSAAGLIIFKNNGSAGFGDATYYTIGIQNDDDDADEKEIYSIVKRDVNSALTEPVVTGRLANTSDLIGDDTWSVCLADFDGNGSLDIAIVDIISDKMYVLEQDSIGSYGDSTLAYSYATGASPRSITAGDLNNDGAPDLIVANYNSDNIYLFFNNGSGIFGEPEIYGGTAKPSTVCPVDLDDDGDLDIVTTSMIDNSVSVRENDGNGVFDTKCDFNVQSEPIEVTGADIDGDGNEDIVVANRLAKYNSLGSPSAVTILINKN